MPVNPASGWWRLYTPGGIPYRNVSLQGVTTREEEGDESSATQVIIIDSGNLGIFLAEAFPPPAYTSTGIAFDAQPVLPGTAMVPVSVSYESWTGNLPLDPGTLAGDWTLSDRFAPAGTYDGDLKVTIEYHTTLENDSGKDPSDPKTFLEISANASGTFFASPGNPGAMWAPPGGGAQIPVVVQLPLTIMEPQLEWSVIWKAVPTNYFDATLMPAMRASMGHVNSVVMPLLKNAPIDTILFLGFSFRQQFSYRRDQSGTPTIHVEMKFQEKNFVDVGGVSVTHQYAHRPGNTWTPLLINGNPLYQQIDMNALWGQ